MLTSSTAGSMVKYENCNRDLEENDEDEEEEHVDDVEDDRLLDSNAEE